MNKYIVEFLGTLVLVFVILVTGNWAAIGATLAVIVLLGANISGACYNPAVTRGAVLNNNLAMNELLPYVVVQFIGGACAYGLANQKLI